MLAFKEKKPIVLNISNCFSRMLLVADITLPASNFALDACLPDASAKYSSLDQADKHWISFFFFFFLSNSVGGKWW